MGFAVSRVRPLTTSIYRGIVSRSLIVQRKAGRKGRKSQIKGCSQRHYGALLPPRRAGLSSFKLFIVI